MLLHSFPTVLKAFAALGLGLVVSMQQGAAHITERNIPVYHDTTLRNFEGQTFRLNVRQVADSALLSPGADNEGKVILFLHGGTVPCEPGFNFQFYGGGWMRHHALNGLDAQCFDLIGYGGSDRPAPMDNPDNLALLQQQLQIGDFSQADYEFELSQIDAEIDQIDDIVEVKRIFRGVDKVSLGGWSVGAARSIAYAAAEPAKVDRLILLGFGLDGTFQNPKPLFLPRRNFFNPGAFAAQTEDSIRNGWEAQIVDRPNQIDNESVFSAVWQEIRAFDPLGLTWGPGISRSPTFTFWWGAQPAYEIVQQPTLLMIGEYDLVFDKCSQVELFNRMTAPKRVQLTIRSASHLVVWEKRRDVLHALSLEWMQNESIDGRTFGSGVVELDGSITWDAAGAAGAAAGCPAP